MTHQVIIVMNILIRLNYIDKLHLNYLPLLKDYLKLNNPF